MRFVPRNSRPAAVALVALVLAAGLAGCLGGSDAFAGSDLSESDSTVDSSRESPSSQSATPQASPIANQSGGNLSVHFIHVGQGASVLVVGPGGETLLYDTGNWNDDGEHVLDHLRARNVTRIDHLVTSHADADHIGGHAAVIDYFETEADGVGAVYDPGVAAATRTYENYLDAVERYDVPLYRTQAGDSIPMDGASVDVLAPPEGYFPGEDRNENSLVLRVGHGNASVLLTGDAEQMGERYLRESYGGGLNASVLAAGHHGSNSSTGPGLLAASDPRAVVIQSAYDSPYGHPHDELLARLADDGVPTYWTGVHGTVAFETDGERFVIRTQRDAATDPLELRSAPEMPPGASDALEPRARFPASASGPAPVDEASDVDDADDAPEVTVATDGGDEVEASNDASNLEVVEIRADAAGDDWENLNDEYVVFRNDGDEPLDLSGWTVADEADHSYSFPAGTALDPGETLTLHTGDGRDGDGDYYWGSGGPVWNNDGDTVFVRTDEGELVTEVRYDS